ncbi:MAG: hypothetical protein ABIE03_05760 [Patescibacteria group bacterium]
MNNETENIKNEDIENSEKTGGDIFPIDKNESTTSTETNDNKEENMAEIKNGEFENSASPAEISKKKSYDSEKIKNDAKAKLFDGIRYAIYIIVGFGAIYGIIWAYKVNNIAEPIGGMKVEIKYINKDLENKKTQIEKNQEKIEQLEKNFNAKKIQMNETE